MGLKGYFGGAEEDLHMKRERVYTVLRGRTLESSRIEIEKTPTIWVKKSGLNTSQGHESSVRMPCKSHVHV